ncbi:MAG: prephenate dehydrogenase/arogenate dehydrogenase family protein [Candidatus Bathyarchaeota archaeon]|nr:prephenate dehydrogenase/arogenate dehydrogenase family protein [Candidatus Bathyarchaeota archaeon]MDH5531874.1 prephenate dehydrogenase/arogenate dehydrogenase family protein [Candidatus Bathyarchaeota archaeon]MDH5712741.1 prephenate dehydrogenase/arogenate dehydrogenase family protein [Candidatus Bathyarchaeota archaeon]
MKVAIIGGTGKMGRWFTKFFLDEGMQVIVSGRSKEKLLKIKGELGVEIADNVNAVKSADRVLISVSIENFENVVREIHSHIRPDQVVMDICSVKEFPVKVMHEYIKTGTTLGTHPMFGPRTENIQNQNFILTPTNNKERRFAKDFKGWLEEKQVNVSIMSPRKHDELMSAVLGLPHFIGTVVCDTLINCVDLAETKRVAGTSYKLLLKLAETVASQDPEFCASLQMNLPKVENVEGFFCEKSIEWLNTIKQKDKTAFADKMRVVKAKLGKIGASRSA